MGGSIVRVAGVRSATQLSQLRSSLGWLIARLHLELEQSSEAREELKLGAQGAIVDPDLRFVFEWLTYELDEPSLRIRLGAELNEAVREEDANSLFRMGQTYG